MWGRDTIGRLVASGALPLRAQVFWIRSGQILPRAVAVLLSVEHWMDAGFLKSLSDSPLARVRLIFGGMVSKERRQVYSR